MANLYNHDENNSTVSWVPGFLRDFLGLSGTYRRPVHYATSREADARSTTNWIPGPLRRSFGLEYAEPKSQHYAAVDKDVAPREEPSRTHGAGGGAQYGSGKASYGSGSRSYAADRSSFVSQGSIEYRAPKSGESLNRSGAWKESETKMTNNPNDLPSRFDGPVQPVTYLVQSWARGALPPQGLSAFSHQLQKTVGDLVGMYGNMLRLQTRDFEAAINSLRISDQSQQEKSGE